MSKITEQDFIANYNKYNGCQASLASHYSLSERTIRNYKSRFIKKAEIVPKQELEFVYVNQKLSVSEIARRYNCSRDTIYRLLEQHNIVRDSKYDIEAIRKAYTVQNKNLSEVSKIAGLSNREALLKLLNKHSIINPIKESITELYKAGSSNAEIAQELGITEDSVAYNLKHHSIFREKQLTIDLDELDEQRLNKTLIELADYYKCSSRTISTYIKRLNKPRKSRKLIFDVPTVERMYAELNLTAEEIGDIFGCSRTVIQNFIREHSIISTNRETKQERLIREFLTVNNIRFEQNNRTVIKPKEIDFYLPEHSLGIELCGLYWHSTKINTNKLHIKNKHAMCEDKGIRLITIFEDELIDKFDIVLNRLSQILKINCSTGYARKCSIKEITPRDGIDFLNKYHIQGSGKNSVYLGAYLNNQLVSVMSFSNRNPAKGQRDKTTELNRFVNPFNIIGVASKMFKYYVKAYSPSEILSYSDNRWNTGNLYELLGFSLMRKTSYNYWYVVRQQRKHRFAFTKQKLLSIFPEEDPTQTEETIAEKHNLYRIYDCGSNVYVWKARY